MVPTAPDLELLLTTPFRLVVQALGPWEDEAVTGFTFQVSTASDFATTLSDDAVVESAYQFAIPTLNQEDALYVRVLATNGDGDSAWSATLTVPAYPRPATPTLELRGSSPQRIGVGVPDVDPAAGVVEFQFTDVSDFSVIEETIAVESGPAVAEHRVPDLDRDVLHYVRARAGAIVDFDETTELRWYSDWSATLEATPGKIGTSDIRTGAVNDRSIEPERVRAANITPTLSLSSGGGLRTIQAGAAGSSQVIFDPDGVRVLDAAGAVQASLPVSGSPILTGATITAASLASQQTSLAGTTSVPVGGAVTVNAGTVPAPQSAPSLDQIYPANYTWSDSTLSHWSLFHDGTYYWAIAYGGSQDVVRRYSLVGSVLTWDGATEWSPTGYTLHSVVKVGSYLYAIGDDGNGTYRFLVRSAPSGSRTTVVSSTRTETFYCWEPALITDGTRIFAVDVPAAGSAQTSLRIRQYNVSGTTLPAATGTTRTMPLPIGVSTAALPEESVALTGVMLASSSPAGAWISISDGAVEKVHKWSVSFSSTGISANPTLQTTTDSGWSLVGGGAPYGLTSSVAMSGADAAVLLGWADAFSIQAKYLWANATTGRTTVSPASASLAKQYGTNVRVVMDYPPSGATRAFVYADIGSGYAERKIVAASAGQVASTTIASSDSAGGAVPAAVDFAGGSSAVIQSAAPGWALYGDGTMSGIQTVPTGAVTAFAGSTAPSGWLLCDGSAVSQTTYASLYAVIGATYNTGSEGAGNFRLPDLRQRFVLGKAASGTGATLGGSGGAIDHGHTFSGSSATSSSVSSHDHSVGDGQDATRNAATNQDTTVLISRGAHNHGGATGLAGSHSHTVTAAGTNSTTNPPYLVLNHIIRT